MRSERKALERKFTKMYPDLRAKVLRYVISQASGLDCEDIADAVFERLWKRVSDGGAVDCVEAMAITIARNLVVDAKKRKRPLYTDDLPGICAGFGFGAPGGDPEGRIDLLAAIRALDPVLREAFELVVLHEQPVAHVAKLLRVGRGVVRRRVDSALAELRRRLTVDPLPGSA